MLAKSMRIQQKGKPDSNAGKRSYTQCGEQPPRASSMKQRDMRRNGTMCNGQITSEAALCCLLRRMIRTTAKWRHWQPLCGRKVLLRWKKEQWQQTTVF